MTAFDKNNKHKGMPDITTKTTEELLAIIANGNLNTPAQNALNEILNNRIIKEGDSDDGAAYRGGVRPAHAPKI